MNVDLSEEELDRKSHRSYILALAGFSFAGLLALVLLDYSLKQNFLLSIYYMLLSFLFYIFSLNLQGYKSTRVQDQFATMLSESATLCMILSILGILFQSTEIYFKYSMCTLALMIWLFDHYLRIRFQWIYLKKKLEVQQNE